MQVPGQEQHTVHRYPNRKSSTDVRSYFPLPPTVQLRAGPTTVTVTNHNVIHKCVTDLASR